jgi:Transcriptional regulator, AbiEi antitoxin
MFHVAQARAAGLDRAALRRLARSGDWVSIHPGVLCDVQLWRGLDEDAPGRHALKV